MNCSPTRTVDLYNTLLDVNKFARTLTLKKHFLYANQDERKHKEYHATDATDTNFLSFEEQSLVCELRCLQQEIVALIDSPKKYTIPGNEYFYPLQSLPPSLDVFQELIERELTMLHNNVNLGTKQNNLTFGGRKALRELSNNPHIVVRSADKGCAITVLDRELYRILSLNALNDTNTYQCLSMDPTAAFQQADSE